jgi:hypothetical protein
MLHTNTVSVALLDVLAKLQGNPALNQFALAGGTSLALRFGHRISIDLDFFSEADFDPVALATHLSIGAEGITGLAKGTLQLTINQVKVEFIKHSYRQLAAHECMENVRMWSLPDVAAMKLNAIANRGSKKDFYDMAALLDKYPLATLLGFYKEKYSPASLLMIVRSLSWFEDADEEPNPVDLSGCTWNQVKEKISASIRSLS